MDWFRWWQGTVNDPKFRAIARRSGQPISLVIACWAYLLEDANENGNGGDSFDAETCSACLDAEPEDIQAIIDALADKGILEDGQLANWDKRQPKREDDSAERVRKYRERKRAETHVTDDVTRCNAGVTHSNAPDTETEVDSTTTAQQGAREESPNPENLPPIPDTPESHVEWINYFTRKGYDQQRLKTPKFIKIFRDWCARGVTLATVQDACMSAEAYNNGPPNTIDLYVRFVESMERENAKPRASPSARGTTGSQRPARKEKFDPFAYVNRNRIKPNEPHAGNTFDGEYRSVESGEQN